MHEINDSISGYILIAEVLEILNRTMLHSQLKCNGNIMKIDYRHKEVEASIPH